MKVWHWLRRAWQRVVMGPRPKVKVRPEIEGVLAESYGRMGEAGRRVGAASADGIKSSRRDGCDERFSGPR